MTEREIDRPTARPSKRRSLRLFGVKGQLTPEELAARNAAVTARKLREIFGLKDHHKLAN